MRNYMANPALARLCWPSMACTADLPCTALVTYCPAGPILLCSALQEELQQQTVAQLADSSGRLPPDALRSLLMLQAEAAGGPLQADRLLER